MIQVVRRLVQVPATRAILFRLFLFLIVVRLAILLPLRADLPDLSPRFHANPFLALLDIFSGGALARGSAFALGVYPFLLGRLAARLRFPRPSSALDLIYMQKLSFRLTLVAAVAMASVYPLFFNHLAGSHQLPWNPFIVLTLATGAMLTPWFGRQLDEEDYRPEPTSLGLRFLVSMHVLASLPEYLLGGSPSTAGKCTRFVIAAVVAGAYLWISSAERRFPIDNGSWKRERRYIKSIYLPFALSSSGVSPLLWLVAVFGLVQLLSPALLRSATPWARDLAAAEQTLTSLRNPASLVLFFWLGLLVKTAYAMAAMAPFRVAGQLRKEWTFIPGVRSGAETGRYLFAKLSRTVWIEPLFTMAALLLAAWVGAGALSPFAMRHRWTFETREIWPVCLIPLLYATYSLSGFHLLLKSELVRSSSSWKGVVSAGI